MPKVVLEKGKSQKDKFSETARELGCDEDPAHFDEALKKVARHKPIVASEAKSKRPKTRKAAQ